MAKDFLSCRQLPFMPRVTGWMSFCFRFRLSSAEFPIFVPDAFDGMDLEASSQLHNING